MCYVILPKHPNMQIFSQHELLKIKIVINITGFQNGKKALLFLRLVYLRIYRISLIWFLLLNKKISTIDSFWYTQLIPLTQAQKRVC